MGTACQNLPTGKLFLKNVLFCPNVTSTIISLGKFEEEDGDVRYQKGLYTLYQEGISHLSTHYHSQWYLQTAFISSVNTTTPESVELWHDRFGHVSC